MVHLHCHTDYSLLDGYCTVEELVDKAIAVKHKAIAITEHANLASSFKFWKQCTDNGIKPIIGYEANLYFDNPKEYYHLTLLAKNKNGFDNLIKINNIGCSKFYYRPLVQLQDIINNKEGIICLSGCLRGYVYSKIYEDLTNNAIAFINKLKDIFCDDFYIELQNHGLEPEIKVLPTLLKIIEKNNLKAVATNDIHYINKTDTENALILRKIANRTNEVIKNLYYKTETEIDLPKEYINTTEEVAEKIEKYNICYEQKLDNNNINEILKDKTTNLNQQEKERIEYELKIIESKKLTNYFITILNIVNMCKENNIAFSVRGSAGGCFLLYLLNIIKINPIEYGLPFERFLNQNRNDPPDIDIEIEKSKREYFINKLKDKYKIVYKILNTVTFKEKIAKNDLSRINELKIEESILEDRIRHFGVHASAVILSKNFINMPLIKVNNEDVLSMNMETIEKAGLLKFDLLGSSNLEIINNIITQNKIKIKANDPKTLNLLHSGKTAGVFQLETDYAKSVISKIKPRTVKEIRDVLALMRPGSYKFIEQYCKNNNRYDNEVLNEVLKETRYTLLFQEQVTEILHRICNISLADAEIIRKSISKKKYEVFEKYKPQIGDYIYNLVIDFAGYGFNKSHATLYAIRCYITAFLKANYPLLFFREYVDTIDSREKINEIIKEYYDTYDIRIDLNLSQDKTVFTDKSIYLPLRCIKGISDAEIESIYLNRPFRTYDDLFKAKLRKNTIEAIIGLNLIKQLTRYYPFVIFAYYCNNVLPRSEIELESISRNEILLHTFKRVINIREKQKSLLGFYLNRPRVLYVVDNKIIIENIKNLKGINFKYKNIPTIIL